MGYKKELYVKPQPCELLEIQTHRTRRKRRYESSNPRRLERRLRQQLADKVSGNLAGIWLLVPEHLRLGTWDLLRG